MIVGCLEVTLAIPLAESLKDKRSVVRKCCDRIQNRFKVSVAEVDQNDNHKRAVLGVAVVANDASFVNSVVDKIRGFVEEDLLGLADVIDSRFELVHW